MAFDACQHEVGVRGGDADAADGQQALAQALCLGKVGAGVGHEVDVVAYKEEASLDGERVDAPRTAQALESDGRLAVCHGVSEPEAGHAEALCHGVEQYDVVPAHGFAVGNGRLERVVLVALVYNEQVAGVGVCRVEQLFCRYDAARGVVGVAQPVYPVAGGVAAVACYAGAVSPAGVGVFAERGAAYYVGEAVGAVLPHVVLGYGVDGLGGSVGDGNLAVADALLGGYRPLERLRRGFGVVAYKVEPACEVRLKQAQVGTLVNV